MRRDSLYGNSSNREVITRESMGKEQDRTFAFVIEKIRYLESRYRERLLYFKIKIPVLSKTYIIVRKR
jgi:hypothetical protein